MMKIRSSRLSAIVAGSIYAFCAGAGIAQGSAESRAPDLRIYSYSELNLGRYEVVSRLWGDSWRTAFGVPTFPTQEQAIAALRTEAARRGADGLLNVNCFDQGRWSWSTSKEPAIFCYGTAIRVLPSQG